MVFYSAIDPTLWRLITIWRDAKGEAATTQAIRDINLYVADLKRQIVDANYDKQKLQTELDKLRLKK